MKKKFLAIYALTGALVASPVFTSCVDDSVSPSVEAIRNAQADLLKSEAAYNDALASAATIKANAEAALNNAKAALEQANAAYRDAEAKEQELKVQLAEATHDADLAKAVAEAEKARIEAENNLAIAQTNAALALEEAKLEAETALLGAQQKNLQAKATFEKVTEGLANEAKIKANYINQNIKAIMNGGNYWMLNADGNWSTKYYAPNYKYSNTQTSIQGLIKGLADEKVELVKLQNDLIDIEEYLVEKKADNEEIIATKTALIAKYKELQTASNREAMEKAYEEAKTNAEDLANAINEKHAEKLTAKSAYTQHVNLMSQDPIQKLINDGCEYLTAIEVEDEEILKDTIVSLDGKMYVKDYPFDAVYERTDKDADELDKYIKSIEDAIDDQEKEIAELEAEIAEVNIADVERVALAAKAEADETLKKYEEVKASEAYKKAVADLEKAVDDAQAAFEKNPTDFATYTEDVENADGTTTTKTIKSTKTLLEEAEEALAAVVEGNQYNYGTEEEPAWLYELYNKLYVDVDTRFYQEEWWTSAIAINGQGLIELAENLAQAVEDYKKGNNTGLETANTNLETLKKSLEAAKELEAMVAPESEEMKAYLALCETREELQKAVFALRTEVAEMTVNKNYYETLESQLGAYVGEEGTLPDYEELIAEAEKAIKDAEQENANLETTIASVTIEREEVTITQTVIRKPVFNADGSIKLDENGDIVWVEENSGTSWSQDNYTTTTNVSKTAKEAEIAKQQAEIAAMEAELEIRQAEYDAEVAALKALVETETAE